MYDTVLAIILKYAMCYHYTPTVRDMHHIFITVHTVGYMTYFFLQKSRMLEKYVNCYSYGYEYNICLKLQWIITVTQ